MYGSIRLESCRKEYANIGLLCMRLQRETPFQKKRKSTARNGNEMEMNGMKSNRLNEMEGIFQLKSSSKKYL